MTGLRSVCAFVPPRMGVQWRTKRGTSFAPRFRPAKTDRPISRQQSAPASCRSEALSLSYPPRGHPRPTGFLRVIILDTNVLPELLAPAPSVAVETWLAEQQTAAEFTTTVTEAELFYGLRLMPDGRRRQELEAAIVPIFREDLAGRILPFGSEAADAFGCIAARRRKLGADQPVRRTNCRDRLVSWCLRGNPQCRGFR